MISGCSKTSKDEKELLVAFERLHQAFVSQNDAALATALDDETGHWLEEMIHAAQNEGREEVEARKNYEVLLILVIRAKVANNHGVPLRFSEVFELATKGLLPTHAEKWTLTDINIQGDIATAGVAENRSSSGICFTRQDGVWKFNLGWVNDVWILAFEKLEQDSGRERMDWLVSFARTRGFDNIDVEALDRPIGGHRERR